MTNARTLLTLAAVAMVALMPAGCSNAPAVPGASTAGGGALASTAAATTAGPSTAARDLALRFARCMRANGVTNFPDPNASGALTIDGIANGSSLNTDSAPFKRAISACRDLEPPGFTGTVRSPEQQAAALKFAQCVRDNGVKDFPDPAPDAPLVDTNLIPSTDGAGGMTILNAALKTCRTSAAAAGVQP